MSTVQCLEYHSLTHCGLQVQDADRSLQERESRVSAAEVIAAKHEAKETTLQAHEHAIQERQAVLDAAEAAMQQKQHELDELYASIKEDSSKLNEQMAGFEARRENVLQDVQVTCSTSHHSIPYSHVTTAWPCKRSLATRTNHQHAASEHNVSRTKCHPAILCLSLVSTEMILTEQLPVMLTGAS